MGASEVGEGPRREVVLVTGFPRAVSREVCAELLAGKGPAGVARELRVLVRPEERDAARALLRKIPGSDSLRVTLLEGDPAAIDLGLSGREFNALASELTHVQHYGVPQGDPTGGKEGRSDASAHALVAATREVLSLARAAPRLKRVLFGSSVGVFGNATGVVREDDLSVGQSFRDAHEEALFKSERLVRRAMETLPITVARHSIVVGHSKTGEVDQLDGPYLLMLLIFTSPAEIPVPLPARGDASLHLVPVDYVARAHVALMDAPEAEGRTFHVVDPAPLPARRAYELVAQVAGKRMPRGFIPANLTRAILRTPGLERLLKSPRAFLERLVTPVSYQSVHAREVLQPRGVECPPFEQYVDPMVGYVRDRVAQRQRVREDEPAAADREEHDPLA